MKTLKKVLAVVLALAMVLGMAVSASATYTDDKAINYDEAVAVMSLAGVLNGYTDGSFKPQGTLTRAEAAKVIVYMLGLEDTSLGYKANFGDINGHWAETPISVAAGLGILAGVGNGKFAPNDTLTGFQWAKILLCAMGYDAEVEGMLGAGWEAKTAKLIKAEDMIDGIKNFNGSKAVTREEACQMAFNVIEADFVGYPDSAITAVKLGTTIETSKKSKFGTEDSFANRLALTEGIDADDKADKFGRPGTTWYVNKGKKTQKSVFLADEPVVTYSEEVNACDMLVDLGYPTSNDDKVKLNNEVVKHDDAKTCGAEKTEFGGQGVLTEVYLKEKATKTTPAEYLVIEINTYLAKVTKVVDEKVSKTGHVTDGYTLVTVYDKASGTENVKLEKLAGYEKGDYILVQFPKNEVKGTKYANVIGEAETLVGKQTARTTERAHIVEGTTYLDAAQFKLDQVGKESKLNHTWFFDQFGNLIGAADIDTVYTYGVVTRLEKIDAVGEADYVVADVVYMDGTTAEDLKVESLTYGGITASAIGYNQISNEKYTDKYLVRISEGTKGLVIEGVGASVASAVSTKGTTLKGGAKLDNDTVFLVRSGKGTDEKPFEYASYVGIDNIGDYVEDADNPVKYFETTDTDDYVDYVFITAAAKKDTAYAFAFVTDTLTFKQNLKDNNVDSYEATGVVTLDGEAFEFKSATDPKAELEGLKGQVVMIKTVGGKVTEVTQAASDSCPLALLTAKNSELVYLGTPGAVKYHTNNTLEAKGIVYNLNAAKVLVDGKADKYDTSDLSAASMTELETEAVYVVRPTSSSKKTQAEYVILSDKAKTSVGCNAHKAPVYVTVTVGAIAEQYLVGSEIKPLAGEYYALDTDINASGKVTTTAIYSATNPYKVTTDAALTRVYKVTLDGTSKGYYEVGGTCALTAGKYLVNETTTSAVLADITSYTAIAGTNELHTAYKLTVDGTAGNYYAKGEVNVSGLLSSAYGYSTSTGAILTGASVNVKTDKVDMTTDTAIYSVYKITLDGDAKYVKKAATPTISAVFANAPDHVATTNSGIITTVESSSTAITANTNVDYYTVYKLTVTGVDTPSAIYLSKNTATEVTFEVASGSAVTVGNAPGTQTRYYVSLNGEQFADNFIVVNAAGKAVGAWSFTKPISISEDTVYQLVWSIAE